MEKSVEAYAAAATPELIARYDALPVEEIYAPLLDLFPIRPSRIADIGAGTGRDAAWLAGRGHEVLAVEPVEALRNAGMTLHRSHPMRWLADELPCLEHIPAAQCFDLLLVCGVWQHLDTTGRGPAMRRLAGLTAPGGKIVMSLRHGPGAPGRPVFPIVPGQTINQAQASGLELLRQREARSIQAENRAMGVSWTWLAFMKPAEVRTRSLP